MAFPLFLIYLAATFIRPFELFPDLIQFNPMAVLGGVALLSALLSRALGRSHLSASPQLLLILLLVLWAAFSVLMTQRWLTGAIDTVIGLSTSLFIFYLLVFSVDTPKRMRITLHLLTALAVVVAMESVCAYHFGYRAEELLVRETVAGESSGPQPLDEPITTGEVLRIRHRGVLGDPNDLAQALIAIMPFVFLAYRRGAVVFNAARVWLPIGIMVYAVVLTRSRGGILALLVLLFLALRQRLRAAFSVAVTTLIAVALLAAGVLAGRSVGMDASADSRTAAWRAGWAMLKASPIWGVGFGYFTEYHERAAHNSYVECFAELGLVGYFLWLGTIVVTFWSLRQIEALDPAPASAEVQRVARASVLALLSFLAAAFFLSRAYQPMLFLVLGIATAITDIAQRRRMELKPLSVGLWFRQVTILEIASVAFIYVFMRVAP